VSREDEWLWGWDPTPGIVGVWAESSGRALVWRRVDGALHRDIETFRPWVLLDQPVAAPGVECRELDGPGALRFLVSAANGRDLARAGRFHSLPRSSALVLPPEEQYLVATGRTYFKSLAFDHLRRMQFDLETTGLDPDCNRIFLIAVRDPDGVCETLEIREEGDAGEADLIRRLMEKVLVADPDVIENHNLHGFDLPFLEKRARYLGVPLLLGRIGPPGLRRRGARRGTASGEDDGRKVRFIAPGRELIDTLDAVLRYDFATRDLPNHGLKAVARHLGISGPEREQIRGDLIHSVFRTDPDRVRRYAISDVEEVAALARMLGGAAFALAQMTPRRYERLADAGAATGVIDPLLVRAYLRAGAALPAYQPGDGTPHSGAALHVFATGVAHRIVKADVASLYPSLMRAYRIGPSRDPLNAMLALVDRLVELRLAAKASARAAPPASSERFAHEAMSAAMKLVVNSAYGYLAAGGELTRFADVHAANEVTRRGRETLEFMCRELAARGVTLLEADTDGVYFAVPEGTTEVGERRIVAEVAALLPPLVQLEFEGRYAAMLSHEPKNYALLGYDGKLLLRGVAFRSSRAEPFGETFLRRAIAHLLVGDVAGVRDTYVDTLDALRRRAFPSYDVSSKVRLTKSPAEYMESRDTRRELAYEALLSGGRTTWSVGDRVRVYRTNTGAGAVVDEESDRPDRRDYDVNHYARLLRDTFAARLARAFTPEDYQALFADPRQMQLFAPDLTTIRPMLQ
jgi:DNA polymerase elongation subunit (family B)